MEKFNGFTKELWHSQPNTLIGVGLAILVLLGIYINILNTYQEKVFHLLFDLINNIFINKSFKIISYLFKLF